jgi:hypothetical protein
MLKCNSCGGTYPDTSEPGTVTYFHVCPRETPNPRNENLKPHPTEPGQYVMISEGSGVTPVE